jgi:predicted transcriptional regulator
MIVHCQHPPALEKFRAALSSVVRSADQSQHRVANRAGIQPTTLSDYLSGRRLPKDSAVVEKLYSAAAHYAAKAGTLVPSSPEELAVLYASAWHERHPGPGPVRPPAPDNAPVLGHQPTSGAADLRASANIFQQQPTPAALSARHEVPVPLCQGDRQGRHAPQRTVRHPGFWAAEISEVRRCFEEDRQWDAYMLLSGAGAALAPELLPEAIAACQQAGLGEAAETLLWAAAQRRTDEVLDIAGALAAARMYRELETLHAARPKTSRAAPL